MKNKERGKIFHQVIRPVTVFQIIIIVLMLVAMYLFSLYYIWSEKKQNSQEISNYTASLLSEYNCIGKVVDYLQKNCDKIEFVYDKERYLAKDKELGSLLPGYTSPENVTDEQFDMMTDDVRKLYAEVCYGKMSLQMDKIKRSHDILYLVAIVHTDGKVFTVAQGVKENEARVSQGGDLYELGIAFDYEIGKYPAWDKVLGIGGAGDAAIPLFDATDNEAVYTISPVYDKSGKLATAVLAANMWVDFLIESLRFTILLFVIVMILIVIQLVKTAKLIIKLIARPLENEQNILSEYITDKEADKAVTALSEIRSNNEIQTLAENFSFMATELERYIGEVRTATAEKERIGTELELASKIQLSALPSKFPAFPDRKEFDIFASMTPAKEVGGDFYDFFFVDDDLLALVIADVSGKGVPASLFMMMSKILINNYSIFGGEPAEIISAVNNRICENNDDSMFVTVWLGILNVKTGKMTCCSAGHEYPVIKKASGKFELLKDKHGLAVGAMGGVPYKNYEIQFEKGDAIFVYTDGVPEATNGSLELFGNDRMVDALNSSESDDPQEILRTVKRKVDEFVGDAPQFDDLTMLSLKYWGE